jgi:hypothetical protein
MFGLDDLVEGVSETISEFMEDPVGITWGIATQPVVDTLDILDGLSEGEIRERAILRLGVDVVSGMALG